MRVRKKIAGMVSRSIVDRTRLHFALLLLHFIGRDRVGDPEPAMRRRFDSIYFDSTIFAFVYRAHIQFVLAGDLVSVRFLDHSSLVSPFPRLKDVHTITHERCGSHCHPLSVI